MLSACSYKELIDQGFRYSDSMLKVYKIASAREHYARVVDMLGRAGRLEEDPMHQCGELFLEPVGIAAIWN